MTLARPHGIHVLLSKLIASFRQLSPTPSALAIFHLHLFGNVHTISKYLNLASRTRNDCKVANLRTPLRLFHAVGSNLSDLITLRATWPGFSPHSFVGLALVLVRSFASFWCKFTDFVSLVLVLLLDEMLELTNLLTYGITFQERASTLLSALLTVQTRPTDLRLFPNFALFGRLIHGTRPLIQIFISNGWYVYGTLFILRTILMTLAHLQFWYIRRLSSVRRRDCPLLHVLQPIPRFLIRHFRMNIFENIYLNGRLLNL